MRSSKLARLAGALLAAVTISCSTQVDRFVQLSQQSVSRQAEQNQQIARQSQEVAEATHELVQADAQARAELVAAQRSLEESLQTERSRLDEERSKLEQDRRALAAAKEREPVVANAISAAALLVAFLLPLALCIYLLRSLGSNETDHDLSEWLIGELTSNQPTLLPAASQAALPRLDGAADHPAAESHT
jgi:hypothetical protein